MAAGSIAIAALFAPVLKLLLVVQWIMGSFIAAFIGAVMLRLASKWAVKIPPSYWTAYWVCVFSFHCGGVVGFFQGYCAARLGTFGVTTLILEGFTGFVIQGILIGIAVRHPNGQRIGWPRGLLVMLCNSVIVTAVSGALALAVYVAGYVAAHPLANDSRAAITVPSPVSEVATPPSQPDTATTPATPEKTPEQLRVKEESDDYERAVAMYPDVATEGSPLQIAVSKRVVEINERNPAFFDDSGWRSKLVKEVAEELVKHTPAPVSFNDQVEASKREAIRRYPAIGRKGTYENHLFIELYQELRRSEELKMSDAVKFFADPDWPTRLVEILAKQQGWER